MFFPVCLYTLWAFVLSMPSVKKWRGGLSCPWETIKLSYPQRYGERRLAAGALSWLTHSLWSDLRSCSPTGRDTNWAAPWVGLTCRNQGVNCATACLFGRINCGVLNFGEASEKLKTSSSSSNTWQTLAEWMATLSLPPLFFNQYLVRVPFQL